jgi:hypothetical protein
LVLCLCGCWDLCYGYLTSIAAVFSVFY